MNDYIQQILEKALEATGLEREQWPEIHLEKPREASHGDVSTNLAMRFAGTLRKSPRQIAEELVGDLERDPEYLSSVEIAGQGFINLRFADSWLYQSLGTILQQRETYGRSGEHNGR